MADDCEDTGHHAPHLQNWRPTRTRLEESRATRRDALEERLQGHRHHTRANACDPSFTALTSSLYAGAPLCWHSAAFPSPHLSAFLIISDRQQRKPGYA